jgi:hypothetical protein
LLVAQGSRAGEAEADVAVGLGAWALKCGAPSHATIGKLNRLIWIEEELERMSEAAQHGQSDVQVAYLQTWQEVYEREKEESNKYAESVEAAAEGA